MVAVDRHHRRRARSKDFRDVELVSTIVALHNHQPLQHPSSAVAETSLPDAEVARVLFEYHRKTELHHVTLNGPVAELAGVPLGVPFGALPVPFFAVLRLTDAREEPIPKELPRIERGTRDEQELLLCRDRPVVLLLVHAEKVRVDPKDALVRSAVFLLNALLFCSLPRLDVRCLARCRSLWSLRLSGTARSRSGLLRRGFLRCRTRRRIRAGSNAALRWLLREQSRRRHRRATKNKHTSRHKAPSPPVHLQIVSPRKFLPRRNKRATASAIATRWIHKPKSQLHKKHSSVA